MSQDLALPFQMGHYTLLRRLGRGGMGVVYAARDDRLDRDVAVKMIAGLKDEAATKRFWREARAAASVSHPNVCQIFEVDEGSIGPFLAMELLEGESLETRLERGACTPVEALRIARDLLGALTALHERGLVHRDVKPANLFITRHGVKLLDFGLARSGSVDTVVIGDLDPAAITMPGIVMGTPAYMSPEQIRTEELDARTDVYSTAVVLFEMLSGRLPFDGTGILEVANAILRENPPALQGSPTIVAIDRVIRRSLSKNRDQRYGTAHEMLGELAGVITSDTSGERVIPVRALVRLIVPPMRLLRDEPSLSFLPYGLAEAVSVSLAALTDVVVRAPSLAKTDGDLDPRKLAVTADVDLIVVGSLLTSGPQIRANLQLIEAGTGTVLGAHAVRGDVSDIFALEDQISQSVMDLLEPHRSNPGVTAEMRAVPARGKAFEYFLRGMEHARDLAQSKAAREWFEKAVEDDPLFAPAWAWLGRCHRVIGKFEEDRAGNNARAEEAFRRALALAPDLPVAHRYLTHLENEGGRADAAIARLLKHATVNRNDANLFAALVPACRYAGLNAASIAAHEEARRLDPNVPTSIEYTYVAAGMFDQLPSLIGQPNIGPGGLVPSLLFDDGNPAGLEGVKMLENMQGMPRGMRLHFEAIRDGVQATTRDAARRALEVLTADGSEGVAAGDPEAMFLYGSLAARIGDDDEALRLLEQAIGAGFSPLYLLETSPLYARIRSTPRFNALLETARRRREVGAAIFERNGGGTLLGLAPGAS
jgi:TolB-like protein/tetratricopeptide (TPR) repeat protein